MRARRSIISSRPLLMFRRPFDVIDDENRHRILLRLQFSVRAVPPQISLENHKFSTCHLGISLTWDELLRRLPNATSCVRFQANKSNRCRASPVVPRMVSVSRRKSANCVADRLEARQKPRRLGIGGRRRDMPCASNGSSPRDCRCLHRTKRPAIRTPTSFVQTGPDMPTTTDLGETGNACTSPSPSRDSHRTPTRVGSGHMVGRCILTAI